jgi:hypothetical protein
LPSLAKQFQNLFRLESNESLWGNLIEKILNSVEFSLKSEAILSGG